MLFYTSNEDEDAPEATIHNVDTGITYTLRLFDSEEGPMPTVYIRAPGDAPLVLPRRLFVGTSAIEFWRALLYRNPWNGASVAPRMFLDRLAGESLPADEPESVPF